MRRSVCASLVVTAVFVAGACERTARSAPERQVVRITGLPRGIRTYHALAPAYRQAIPHVDFELLPYSDSIDALAAVQNSQADLTITLADIAYSAYAGKLGEQFGRFDQLRGLALLWRAQVHLVVPSGSRIQRLEDLQRPGLTVGIQRNNPLTARLILSAAGIVPSSVHILLLDLEDVQEVIQRMEDGTLDAVFLNSASPEAVVTVATRRGARLIPLSGRPIDQLLRGYPFFQLTTIRAGTYPHHQSSTHTLGIRSLLVTRSGISERMGYLLSKEFFAYLSRGGWGEQSRSLDLMIAPSTPIPLHDGAALYYRERELFR